MSSDQTLPSDLSPKAGNKYTLVIQNSGSDARHHEDLRQPPYWHEVLSAAVHARVQVHQRGGQERQPLPSRRGEASRSSVLCGRASRPCKPE